MIPPLPDYSCWISKIAPLSLTPLFAVWFYCFPWKLYLYWSGKISLWCIFTFPYENSKKSVSDPIKKCIKSQMHVTLHSFDRKKNFASLCGFYIFMFHQHHLVCILFFPALRCLLSNEKCKTWFYHLIVNTQLEYLLHITLLVIIEQLHYY